MTDSCSSAGAARLVIKKYDKRFYDTERNLCITLNELRSRVKERQEFTVVDARSGEDLTREVLAHSIRMPCGDASGNCARRRDIIVAKKK